MNSEQGRAWQERAELSERENERLHSLVQELRDSLMAIRDETAFMDSLEMPISSMRNAALFAHGKADHALAKAGMSILACPMVMQCIPLHPSCPTCLAADPGNGADSKGKE